MKNILKNFYGIYEVIFMSNPKISLVLAILVFVAAIALYNLLPEVLGVIAVVICVLLFFAFVIGASLSTKVRKNKEDNK